VSRGLDRVVTTPPPAPGFIGEGHLAVLAVDPTDFGRQDPFIILADDRLELPPGNRAGEAHPHAGFETVTFVLEGTLHDRDEGDLHAGDVLWMTAGRGVIHNEDVVPEGRSRIFQLWLTLPSHARWSEPRFEIVRRDDAPLRRSDGAEARVYSGRSGDARSTTHNYVPVTMIDVRLDAGATFEQELPASYNGFVYPIEGTVRVGDDDVNVSEVGWLSPSDSEGASVVRFAGGERGARFMLYAGEPTNVPLVMHGPFVGETRADLMRVSRDYMEGRFVRMSELARDGVR
jgi:hypothetical protein